MPGAPRTQLVAPLMGNEREILETVKLGMLDMGMADHSYLSNYVPEWGLYDLPFLFRDYDHLEKCLNGRPGLSKDQQ